MQTKTPPTGNKTSWSKQSAVLLINIVKDVEQKILKKELLVRKENEKTKWDYVAEFLHEASVSDASKTPNNCQYKFWELNRQFKFLLKETSGKTGSEEKEGPIFSALKAYYGNFPSIKKNSRLQRRLALFKGSRNESERQVSTDNPLLMKVDSSTTSYPTYESEDDSGGSLHNVLQGECNGHLVTTSQGEDQSEDDSAGNPYQHGNDEVAEQLHKEPNAKGSSRSKRKAGDVQSLDLVEEEGEADSSYPLKQLVDKMARLTSYMKWKETGVGEDWRCDFTDRIERRQKRGIRKSVHNANSVHVDAKTQAPDEIETALREDILSFWNELDKNRPNAEECHEYYLKRYAGEVNY